MVGQHRNKNKLLKGELRQKDEVCLEVDQEFFIKDNQ